MNRPGSIRHRHALLAVLMLLLLPAGQSRGSEGGTAPDPILVGLDADLSAASAKSGQSIRRGALIAIDEINSAGGVLGRPLELVERDHRGNPARAKAHMAELADTPGLVAVLGGLHTPAALEVLPIVHEKEVIFLIPWAAGTTVVENGYLPNYVFRVSVRDADAGPFLVKAAKADGHRRLGLLLENTGWGRSNHAAMTEAAVADGLPQPIVQWFNWGVRDLGGQIGVFLREEIDAILLVANAPEGLTVLRALRALDEQERLPIFSHWGISGGDFGALAGEDLQHVDLRFLQTFSFIKPPVPDRADALWDAHRRLFPEFGSRLEAQAVPGLAHAYDLVHILAEAIEAAGATDRPTVRSALESLERHEGVMKDYRPPFAPGRHDALNASSFHLARFNSDGQVVPVEGTGHGRRPAG